MCAMTLTMTVAEREAFLAGLHVGIISVDDPGRGPLSVPVWYAYEPGGSVNVVTGNQSVKARRLRAAGRFSLCVQTEASPYRYVSVEGRITAVDEPVTADERRALAQRYLGAEGGDLYIAATAEQTAGGVAFRMTPEHWRTSDYGKGNSLQHR
jgi:PPOX class probable F420-dependent enzyme